MREYDYHLPVMIEAVERYLITDPSGTYVDMTLGGGGHSFALLEKYKNISVIGLDQDQAAIDYAAKRLVSFGSRVKIIKSNFVNTGKVLEELNVGKVNGIFADLGVSSKQLDDRDRGFSFMSDNLDMRMDRDITLDASMVVNTYPKERLSEIFKMYGEEYMAERIAERIVLARAADPICSGKALAEIVAQAKRMPSRINPATKVFQALRIFVNDELGRLQQTIENIPAMLLPGARIVIITYHSLEDRIVKFAFRALDADKRLKILTKKVIIPAREEIKSNRRSRSAKLRAAEGV